jgi:hypothetical protein
VKQQKTPKQLLATRRTKISSVVLIIGCLIPIFIYGRALSQDFNLTYVITGLILTPFVIGIALIPLFIKFRRINKFRKNGMVAYPAKIGHFASRKLFALASDKDTIFIYDISKSNTQLIQSYSKATTALNITQVAPGGYSTIPGIEVRPEGEEPIYLIMYDKSFFITPMVKPERIKNVIREYMNR